QQIDALDIADMVSLLPQTTHHEALEEQARADGLLLFQGRHYNRQIPAKVYEYLRVGRPVFALVDTHGDTAALLRDCSSVQMAPLDDATCIQARLSAFVQALRHGDFPTPDASMVRKFSRSEGALSLAGLLDGVTATPG